MPSPQDETETEPYPMPDGIAKAPKSLHSGFLSSLAMITIYKIYAVGIKRKI
jgi:hypothetical protein